MVGVRLFLLTFWLTSVFSSISDLSADFFISKKLPFVTGFLCNEMEKNQLARRLAASGIRINFPVLENIKHVSQLNDGLLLPASGMTGVFVSMKCTGSKNVLTIASENRFFDLTHHWLILASESFSEQEFDEISRESEPNMFNLTDFLNHENEHMRYGKRIEELNRQINREIFNDPTNEKFFQIRTRNFTAENSKEEMVSFVVGLKALADSEVTLAVPKETGYEFYEIFRQTLFTKMILKKFVPGSQLSAILGRKNFNGTLMRVTAALLYYDYYSRSDDLTTAVVDQWAIKGIQLTAMAEKRYNYRMVIKCVDDYGWVVNGKFTGMVKHLAEQRSDMTAGGLLLVDVRMGGITYIASSYKVRLDLFFKQPALSQVANIFVLPFAKTVWISLFSLLLFTATVLVLQFRLIEKLEKALTVRIFEIFTFVTGAACQQGTDLGTNVLSARLTMIVYLIASLFLFTSYSANIVSLLQSSSDAIKTVRDFLGSSIEMGLENLPYQVNLIEGDSDPLIRELFQKKLAEKKMKGTAYLNATAGMRKVRRGLYAFHMETEAGARIMGETFSESEKCFVKTITLFPNRFNGHAVPKNSPFQELLKQFIIWYDEIGFLQRNEARFGYKLPKCAGKGASGFNSIGLSDIHSITMMFECGVAASFVIMIVENFIRWFKKRKFKLFTAPVNLKKKTIAHEK